MSATSPEMNALKSKLKTTWMAGDFGLIAKSYETGAADFVKRLRLRSGIRVLDVACGTGNLSIPAAKAGATVTGVDIATNLLEQAQINAETEGVTVQFEEGDAESLSYPDASFDAVITMFGAMFAPRPELVAAELLRVCKPGGIVAMANWTASGFIGKMFKIISGYVPPPNVPSPIQWGSEDIVRERLGAGTDLRCSRPHIALEFSMTGKELIDFWRQYYGPTNRAFEALAEAPEKQDALHKELEHLWTEHNQHSDGTTRVESEYLEVHAVRQ